MRCSWLDILAARCGGVIGISIDIRRSTGFVVAYWKIFAARWTLQDGPGIAADVSAQGARGTYNSVALAQSGYIVICTMGAALATAFSVATILKWHSEQIAAVVGGSQK